MRLLEWNSLYKEDVNNIVRYLKQVEADIVCLQEVTVGEISGQVIHEAEHIAKNLNNHFYFKEAQGWGSRSLPTEYSDHLPILVEFELV